MAAVAVLLLTVQASVLAHRLDEYLQATIFSLERNQIRASMRLVPGVAVSSIVLASVDADGDGVISASEQRIYAEQVLRDLSLTVDGHRLTPRLIYVEFPGVEAMKVGLGEIQIEYAADIPKGGPNRRVVFENHHQPGISAYLVNCLVPHDANIRIVDQYRDQIQSRYQLDYLQTDAPDSATLR